jgi:rhombotail lipoprotein
MQKRTPMIALLALPILSGCMSLLQGNQEIMRSGTSSSLVDYLYPDGEIPPAVSETLPHLELPLRVGIAFVPSSRDHLLSGAQKAELLNEVASTFRERQYVSSIEAIPDQYLASSRGIIGMQQVAALYDIDVMALVSYDQVAFTGERDAALLYWTIVGTALVKGNTNEVRTMIDTAVFDVPTARLLFRAPGTDQEQRNATFIDAQREMRHLQTESFAGANRDMIVNLDAELGRFEERVKQGEVAQVSWSGGSGGGGSTGLSMLAILLAGLAWRRLRPASVV